MTGWQFHTANRRKPPFSNGPIPAVSDYLNKRPLSRCDRKTAKVRNPDVSEPTGFEGWLPKSRPSATGPKSLAEVPLCALIDPKAACPQPAHLQSFWFAPIHRHSLHNAVLPKAADNLT